MDDVDDSQYPFIELEYLLDSGDEVFPPSETSITKKDTWSSEATTFLIVTRMGVENDFIQGKKNKNTLWSKCIEKMRKSLSDFPKSPEDAKKKFSNLIVTYNRIKKRKRETGRGPLYWKHFERFDAVYGVRHNIVPPKGLVFDSSNTSTVAEQETEDSIVSIPECSSVRKSNKRKKKNDDTSELLLYLKQEDEKEQKRHEEHMQKEKEKNELEKERLKYLKEMVDMVKNSE